MSRNLDREKIEAALRKAGSNAAAGSPLSRSGRIEGAAKAKTFEPSPVVPQSRNRKSAAPLRTSRRSLIDRKPSSVIAAISYDAQRLQLRVDLVSGRTYVYENVPPEVNDEFLAAPSWGKYYNAHIRDAFPFHEVL